MELFMLSCWLLRLYSTDKSIKLLYVYDIHYNNLYILYNNIPVFMSVVGVKMLRHMALHYQCLPSYFNMEKI